jgi:hypothetical protein
MAPRPLRHLKKTRSNLSTSSVAEEPTPSQHDPTSRLSSPFTVPSIGPIDLDSDSDREPTKETDEQELGLLNICL